MAMRRAQDVFRSYLTEKGLRHTQQRDAILDAFLSSDRHITIEELHKNVQKTSPEIGYATVHRNLKLMCECGLAEEIKIGTKKARYEPAYGQEHHDHLICVKCGEFTEVNDPKIERLQEKLAEAHGFNHLSHKLEIYGICRKCR